MGRQQTGAGGGATNWPALEKRRAGTSIWSSAEGESYSRKVLETIIRGFVGEIAVL